MCRCCEYLLLNIKWFFYYKKRYNSKIIQINSNTNSSISIHPIYYISIRESVRKGSVVEEESKEKKKEKEEERCTWHAAYKETKKLVSSSSSRVVSPSGGRGRDGLAGCVIEENGWGGGRGIGRKRGWWRCLLPSMLDQRKEIAMGIKDGQGEGGGVDSIPRKTVRFSRR